MKLQFVKPGALIDAVLVNVDLRSVKNSTFLDIKFRDASGVMHTVSMFYNDYDAIVAQLSLIGIDPEVDTDEWIGTLAKLIIEKDGDFMRPKILGKGEAFESMNVEAERTSEVPDLDELM